ncbi:MAG: hypothetical protein KDD94_02420 [Calditrichaeota bacterium]|nr:hypothetical protein [Calditrichota bacterium]
MRSRIGKQVDRQQFGKELRDLIFEKGYTSLYDFHQKSAQDHISYTALKQTVRGKVEASFSNLLNIAEALKMKPEDFFKQFSFKRLS